MNQPVNQNDDSQPSIWARQLPLETETCFFILASALDVVMTYILLSFGPEFQESNQIAAYFLAKSGFKGMVYFKFALVAFVTTVAQIVAKTRPKLARRLLNGGTIITAAVVIYSASLWFRHTGFFG